MDYDVLKETLRVTLEEVAFRTDPADPDKNISILGKAEQDLKDYLENNTSISDNEKAKTFSNFLTNTITNVTTQAIVIAGQAPLQDIQAQTLKDETAQKIASMQLEDALKSEKTAQEILSMQTDDKVKLNNSAVEVSKAKIEIEQLIPAQIQEITANIALKEKEIDIDTKKLDLMDKDIAIKEKEITLKETANSTELKKIDLMTAQTANETKKLDLMEKDITLKETANTAELKKIDIMDKDLLIKEQEVILKSTQNNLEAQKIGLTREQIRVAGMDVQYKLAQLKAIEKAGELNKEIEASKNETQLEIAKIYALR